MGRGYVYEGSEDGGYYKSYYKSWLLFSELLFYARMWLLLLL